MSRIKDVVIDNDVSVFLDSGLLFSFPFFNDYINDIRDSLVGVEIFDQEKIDNIIRCDDRDVSFYLSKIFLNVAALEAGVSLFRYIGDNVNIPSIIYRNNVICINSGGMDYSNCCVVSLDSFFTVSDFLLSFFNNKNIVLYGDDDIIVDLAVGLGIPFIKVDNLCFVDKLISIINDL